MRALEINFYQIADDFYQVYEVKYLSSSSVGILLLDCGTPPTAVAASSKA
jgi:hypothetical protein